MKSRFNLMTALAVWLLASGLFNPVSAHEGSKAADSAKGSPYGEKTAFIISKIDAAAAEEFKRAWHVTRNGANGFEGLVLVYKAEDGSISARSQGKSEEQHRFTFRFTPNIIAVVHTHPNVDNPLPGRADLKVADRFLVPVFTLTRRGMYVYDPETRKISIVRNGLDWLKSSKWKRERLSSGDTHSRAFKPTAKETPQ